MLTSACISVLKRIKCVFYLCTQRVCKNILFIILINTRFLFGRLFGFNVTQSFSSDLYFFLFIKSCHVSNKISYAYTVNAKSSELPVISWYGCLFDK